MKQLPLILLLLLASCRHNPESLNVIPIPQQIELSFGTNRLDVATQLHIAAPEPDHTILKQYIASTPLAPTITTSPNPERANRYLKLEIVDILPKVTSPEGYILDIRHEDITISSTTGAGLFYGLQTLLQLYNQSPNIPVGTFTDEPRMAYRGIMLDVSRHFFDVDFIKKQIDAMAHFKLNHLHLHLTDAAGWRLEIKQYPQLTKQAAWRTHATWKEWWNADRHYVEEGSDNAHGGYYTQEQIRDLVAYAQERYITIIPEIEMPSHSEEVLAAYPELSCSHQPYGNSDFCIGNEATFEFLENVLSEVMELFPSEYIHIGGDEASKQAWNTCPQCQARMQHEGLTTVDELQSYLIHRIERFLNSNGRQLLGWDEILDGGLAPRATVMSWRGTEGGLNAIAAGHRAIMTPGEYCYLDAYQDAPHTQPEAIGGYLPLHKVYSYNPIPDTLNAEQHKLLYGVQCNLFTEYISTPEHMEYMLYPRMLAIAEVGWSIPENMSYEHFLRRTKIATKKLQQIGYNTFNIEKEIGNRPGSEQFIEHLAVGKQVNYINGSSYYSGYTAGGDTALVDGLRGGWTYGDRRWQGFLGRKGIDIVIDLEKIITIHSISADFMQICGPGVFMPAEIIISVSTNGESFTELKNINNEVIRNDDVTFETFGWEGHTRARYVRYQAIRSHHGGFLFADEIVVK